MMFVAPSERSDAGARQRHLHDVLREIARGVGHALVGGGDVAGGGVVVGAEVGAPAPSLPRGHQGTQGGLAIQAEDRLRRLDHDLELQGAGREPILLLQHPRQGSATVETCSGIVTLGRVITKFAGKRPLVRSSKRGHEQVEGSQAAREELARKGLDADADEGGQAALGHRLRDLFRRAHRVRVFLRVGPVAVAVLEVDPEVLDRLALELGLHPRVDPEGQIPRQAQGVAQDVRIGRVLAQRPLGQLAELASGFGGEELRAAVEGVDGLAVGRVAWSAPGEGGVGPLEPGEGPLESLRRQRGPGSGHVRPSAAPTRCGSAEREGRRPRGRS